MPVDSGPQGETVPIRTHFEAILAEKDRALVLQAEVLRREMAANDIRIEPLRKAIESLESARTFQSGVLAVVGVIATVAATLTTGVILALLAWALKP